jgi:hypothetical protein
MTALYDPVMVATFQIGCSVGGIVCAALAMKEHGRRVRETAGERPPASPWLVYGLGFLVGCMLAQLARYARQPASTLSAIATHTCVVALLVLLWGICNTYARLWSRNQRPPREPQPVP